MGEKLRVEKGVSGVQWVMREVSGKVHIMLTDGRKKSRSDFLPTIKG